MSKDKRRQFEAIYEKYMPPVMGRCMNILKNEEEAEDAVQDVFIKFFDSYGDDLDSVKKIPHLLMTIATRHCLNILRKNKRTANVDDIVREKDHRDYEEQKRSGEQIDIVEHLSDKLLIQSMFDHFLYDEDDEETRLVCWYYYHDYLSIKSIAEMLRKDESYVEEKFKNRSIYFMSYLDNMTLKEMSKETGIPKSTLSDRFQKFEEKARTKYKGEE
jgi:RNA polymerase sigma-70 factor (ECF subfamily)